MMNLSDKQYEHEINKSEFIINRRSLGLKPKINDLHNHSNANEFSLTF